MSEEITNRPTPINREVVWDRQRLLSVQLISMVLLLT